jgi:hypothetical protein
MVSFMVNAFGVQHEQFAPRFPEAARAESSNDVQHLRR